MLKPCCQLLFTLLLTACAHPPATPAQQSLAQARAEYWRSPYQPAAINQLALQLVQAGDSDTARLLWYRALRIAPDRDDIRANLLLLEAGTRQLDQSATDPLSPASSKSSKPPPPLPAPWQRLPQHSP
ncbi:hypothetical protein HZU77_004885 [Neisseriaceae bacterium TC5R-5]|nr:hypothetical protein [Neisseriaceae bacterium TC5R-5]